MAFITLEEAARLQEKRRKELEDQYPDLGMGKREKRELEVIYWGMRARCEKESATGYKYYGARGIRVCDRWKDFNNFARDMGARPSKEYSLDRIDPNKGYEPGNVRWATALEQAQNRRNFPGHVVGVRLQGKYWVASGTYKGKHYHLYCGPSYTEAVWCRRIWQEERGL